jgi:uncharacterized protein (DUF1778 family)
MAADDTLEVLERIETRVSPDDKARISAAAQALHESIAKFVSRAALKEADEVLGRPVDMTWMPASEFDALMSALDQPPHAIPELVRLAESNRMFTRH